MRAGRAELADGTLAGSVATMDGVFRWLARDVGLGVVSRGAAHARRRRPMRSAGAISAVWPWAGRADVVVLDDALRVRQTWVGGVEVWNSGASGAVFPTGGQQ